jgi:hypothetical protein
LELNYDGGNFSTNKKKQNGHFRIVGKEEIFTSSNQKYTIVFKLSESSLCGLHRQQKFTIFQKTRTILSVKHKKFPLCQQCKNQKPNDTPHFNPKKA